MSKAGDKVRAHMDNLINWHWMNNGTKPRYLLIYKSQWDTLVRERRGIRFEGRHRGIEVKPHTE